MPVRGSRARAHRSHLSCPQPRLDARPGTPAILDADMREGSESALPGGSETASATASRQAVPAGEALQAEDAAVERRQEDPVLSFTNYAVGFHVAPLKTRSLGPHQREPVAVTFPHELDLESEGEPIRLVWEGAHHGERVRHAIVL